MRFNTFIANLRNFNEMKRELTDKKDLLSDMYYHHSGVKGCDPSKIPVHGSEEASADAKLIQAERISELEKEIKWIRETLRLTKKYLNKQEDETRQLLIRLYLLGENQEKIAKLNGYPNVSKMIRDIKKAYRS